MLAGIVPYENSGAPLELAEKNFQTSEVLLLWAHDISYISKAPAAVILYVTETLMSHSFFLSFVFSEGPYDFGGVLTNTNRDVVNGETVQKRSQAQKEMHWWKIIYLSNFL